MKDALKSKLKATCSEETYDCITILKTPRRDSGLLEQTDGPKWWIGRFLIENLLPPLGHRWRSSFRD